MNTQSNSAVLLVRLKKIWMIQVSKIHQSLLLSIQLMSTTFQSTILIIKSISKVSCFNFHKNSNLTLKHHTLKISTNVSTNEIVNSSRQVVLLEKLEKTDICQ